MRFLHLADLHLGKSLHGLSLLESGDQPRWVDRLIEGVDEVRPDAVVLAGDVYDRSAPSGAAVQLFSRLLTALSERAIPVLAVAGNHDSAQRLAFASPVLAKQGVHLSPDLYDSGALTCVTLEDARGPVRFWLMPYVFPALVSQVLKRDDLNGYDDAVRALLAAQPIDFSERNVLVAHQNVTAHGQEVLRGGSESMVGGVGQVEYTAFDGFDYVALGHIHAACPVGRDAVRYAGSPLCYHFAEIKQPPKGPVLVELGGKGAPVRLETLHIEPLHPLRELRGPYPALRDAALSEENRGEYLRVVLTDRRVGPEEADFLRALFESRGSRMLEIASEYRPERGAGSIPDPRAAQEKPVEALFADFYADRTGGEGPDDETLALLSLAGERLRHAASPDAPTRADVDALLAALTKRGGDGA